ncbi:MAG: hypothetical protein KatS3mg002_0988 [Candidatus Woesearchaeota archaeon]|nr:MAG: hypothetical protein KatS3mg002_0988 [Candidatus Woesearchaeota archaeon]
MTVKCSCKSEDCNIKIRIDRMTSGIWFTDKEGKETLMDLDANTIVKLITELRNFLIELTNLE